ncbi:hypothetical protein [Actinobaculum sp. 313]|uniref:hypothetical protein n=1 Tax=Actinobaculum sp. 313 TaxID=2495645 RepID=UPI0013DDCD0E|nr:hypothetical protein [Actinobaculum sp. 313]
MSAKVTSAYGSSPESDKGVDDGTRLTPEVEAEVAEGGGTGVVGMAVFSGV